MKARSFLARFLYGAFFIVVLPLLLVLWARASGPVVQVPLRSSLPLGLVLSSAGVLLMVLGMAALWIHGRGLPMNLAPPPKYVTQGIFRLLPHPIYTGFCLLCVGVSIAAGSASGLWLVSPLVMLGCVALVLGYERHDLRNRFGPDLVNPCAILPADESRPPTTIERINCYLAVLFPWLFLYEAVVAAGLPHDAVSAYLPFENRLPVWEWTEPAYASCYLLTALVPLAASTARDLRRFAVRGLLAMAVVFPLYLVLPLVAVPRPFSPHSALGTLLTWERALDTPAEAFPSFHVIWALLAAEVFAARAPALRWVWRGWAWLVAASCITTGMHAILDVLSGFLLVAFVSRAAAAWGAIRACAERICNSWKDWRLGPLRVINHGAYAGLAGFAGVLITLLLTGPHNVPAVFLAAVMGLVGAGLWAQFIEGSPVLLRPFGFYGGLLGIVLGCLLAPLTGSSIWLLLAAYSVSAPWIQAIGRLRCLVQGCCHGRPAAEAIGIRYVHPLSRVTRLTEWAGIPLHPTPAYSILWNIVLAAALARLWTLHARLNLIVGLYLILSGLGRFVEEAYRGEPQTPIFARLRIYQWMAIGTITAGALVSALGHAAPAPAPSLAPTALFALWSLAPALAFGLLSGFALGVDFPHANRRFARLV